jgi:hypothetical protein
VPVVIGPIAKPPLFWNEGTIFLRVLVLMGKEEEVEEKESAPWVIPDTDVASPTTDRPPASPPPREHPLLLCLEGPNAGLGREGIIVGDGRQGADMAAFWVMERGPRLGSTGQ